MTWDYFSWEAFATLVTGLAAVGGAGWLGHRQTKILAKQGDILDHQTRLERAKLRFDMFDRRYAYVELFDRFLQRVKSDRAVWTTVDTEFLTKSREAEFLFPRELKVIIDEVWTLGNEYQSVVEDLDNDDTDVVAKARERRAKIRAELSSTRERFGTMCETELRPFAD